MPASPSKPIADPFFPPIKKSSVERNHELSQVLIKDLVLNKKRHALNQTASSVCPLLPQQPVSSSGTTSTVVDAAATSSSSGGSTVSTTTTTSAAVIPFTREMVTSVLLNEASKNRIMVLALQMQMKEAALKQHV